MSNSNKVSAILVLICLVSFGSANVDQDRAQCADQLVGLAECLPYVGGDAKNPTINCCTGIKEVVQRSKKCLCVLIKDHDDPSLGLKINVTLAVQLPTACHVPINISTCVDILKLPSSSPDAKMFLDFENKTEASNRTAHAPSGAIVSQEKSNGGNQLGLGGGIIGIEVLFGTLLWFHMIHLVFWV